MNRSANKSLGCMPITKQYLLQHRANNGAWTRKQLEVLGIKYPPPGGWMSQLDGKVLSEFEKHLFECAKHETSEYSLSHIKFMARRLSNVELADLATWIESIR